MNNAGLYVHIPFCASKCSYCNFVSGNYSIEIKQRYVTKVLEEAARRKDEVGVVDSLYFGGGTPGQLPVVQFERLMDGLRKNFHIAHNAEITFETNPETVTDQYCRALKSSGVNRVSLGLQATQDCLLSRIRRRHTYADFLCAVDRLVGVGIDNLSADIMLGLPDQTEKDVEDSLFRVTKLPLTHVSVYALKVEEGTPLFDSGYETDDDAEASYYETAVKLLGNENFARYETSNFARDGYECRHNIKYWTLSPYLGLGLAAHSDTMDARSYNTPKLSDYLNGALPTMETVSEKTRKEEMIMLALRLENGLDRAVYSARFGKDVLTDFSFEKVLKLNCIVVTPSHIRIPSERAYVANSILSEILI